MARQAQRLAPDVPTTTYTGIPAAVLGVLILHMIIVMPGYPPSIGLNAFLRLPLELPLIVLVLSLSRGLLFNVLRIVIVPIAALLVLLRLANLGSHLAFGRSFNPLLEMHLVLDGWNLASGAIGLPQASLLTAVAVLLLGGLCVLLYRCLGAIAQLGQTARKRFRITASTVLVTGLMLMIAEHVTDSNLRVQAKLTSEVTGRIESMKRSIADLQLFTLELSVDPISTRSAPQFGILRDKDVIVIFVESYGRTFIDEPLFAEAAAARLQTMQSQIEGAGLHVKTGWARSSVTGGRSWLTHATLMSGLRVTNQTRFDRLTVSDRVSLARLFGEAGWRTAAAMPAIQLDWPEGQWYGFEDIRDAHTLGYKGLNFEWVTMPDQYVLSTFEATMREPAEDSDGRPVMATLALISSHAPWTPLPYPIDWNDVGDGAVFDGSHRYGVTPRELWRDPAKVREYYALSLDYSLEIIGQYLERYADDALIVVLGDHQPASIIVQEQATEDVPLHIVARDPELLERLPQHLFVDGMLPGKHLPSQPLESLREMFSERFEKP